ncbi:AAA family ATPase [Halocatena halophila]|uniref:AAA family ATPase n=1 Tax=Halocatena halophila TaxID=2814576 RepID=UPI002ED527C3
MDSLALVGAAGGVGTTRTTLELGATLTRAELSVIILDGAYTTQGLADHVSGSIGPDMMAVSCDEATLPEGLIEIDTAAGTLSVCPAFGPFDRLAQAKAPTNARRFGELIESATSESDVVLVDCPPVGANQAIAAVTTAEQVLVVTPAGRPASRLRAIERLADLGVTDPRVVVTGEHTDDTLCVGPPTETDPAVTPTADAETSPYATEIAMIARELFSLEL